VIACFANILFLSLLGSYECKLCLTLHNNEGSYLAHTQGKKHQANLARRAAKEAKESPQQVKQKLDTV
jgi:splicing factor 3A subunit 2